MTRLELATLRTPCVRASQLRHTPTLYKIIYHITVKIDYTVARNLLSKNMIKENTSPIKEAKMYADGGSRGNPGPSAGGFAILDMENNVVITSGKYLGITTNNQAEYHSLKGGVEEAVKLKVRELHVYMDSLLVVNQMKGIYKIKNRDLWPIHQAIKELLPKFDKVTFQHVPREMNKLADSIVNETLDDYLARMV